MRRAIREGEYGFSITFVYDTAQNAVTTFDHMNNLFHWMHENNLFIKYGIICDTKDWCSKQYRRGKLMWLLSVLEFTHIVIIYIIANVPGNGRIKIDGINGVKNIYLIKNIHDRHQRIK